MEISKLNNIFFSPSGTTEKVSKMISEIFSDNPKQINLLKTPILTENTFSENEVVVVSMPVFAGRIPQICVPQLKNLKGNGTPAIAVVVFGNRAYDDALLELCDILESCGFNTIGAAAFVAQHSIFNQVAHGRPDKNDIDKISKFAALCSDKLDRSNGSFQKLNVNGHRPYCKVSNIPLKPEGNYKCIKCGACAKICPVGAIDVNSPINTNTKKCISCTACISVCPTGSRKFRGGKYILANKGFVALNSKRVEPSWFI